MVCHHATYEIKWASNKYQQYYVAHSEIDVIRQKNILLNTTRDYCHADVKLFITQIACIKQEAKQQRYYYVQIIIKKRMTLKNC